MALVYNPQTLTFEEKEMLGDPQPNEIKPVPHTPDEPIWDLIWKMMQVSGTPGGLPKPPPPDVPSVPAPNTPAETRAATPRRYPTVPPGQDILDPNWTTNQLIKKYLSATETPPAAEPTPTPIIPPKTGASQPAKKRATAPAAASVAKEPVKAGTPTASGTEEQKAPEFPEYKFTERYSPEGELTSMIEGLPRTVEELAGERPVVPKKSFWDSVIQGGQLGVIGKSPWAEKEKQQARLDKQYAENVELQKSNLIAKKELQLKIIGEKITANKETREKEEQAYALLGQQNPLLAQNPNYVAGLFKDLPKEFRDKLVAESIDPKTGQFKPNSPLYMSELERWKYKVAGAGRVLQSMGINDPKEAARLAADPKTFWETFNDGKKAIERQIADLSHQPQTPENQAKLMQLNNSMAAMLGKADELNDYKMWKLSVESFQKEMQAKEAQIRVAFKKADPKALDEAIKANRVYYAGLIKIADLKAAGGKEAVYAYLTDKESKKTGTDKTPAWMSDPINKAIAHTVPGATGEQSANMYRLIGGMIYRVGAYPPGTDYDEIARPGPKGIMSQMDYEIYAPAKRSWEEGIKNTYGAKFLLEAAQPFGGKVSQIPPQNLAKAYSAALEGYPSDQVRRILLEGAAGQTAPSAPAQTKPTPKTPTKTTSEYIGSGS